MTFALLSLSNVARAAPQIGTPTLEDRSGGTPAAPAKFDHSGRPFIYGVPVCDSNSKDTYSLADTMAIVDQLLRPHPESGPDCPATCQTDPAGGCTLLQASGGTQLNMCGPPGHPKQSACYNWVAMALETFNTACQKNYQIAGTVNIPYLDGVTLQLSKT